MEADAFFGRLNEELVRLGVTDHDARFANILHVDERILEALATVPDGSGPAAFYSRLGADWEQFQREEREWALMSDAERRLD